MAICIYPPQAEDFTTNGLGILTPLECTVEEVAAGKYELELVHPIDNTLRWAQIANGCILKVPAPVRENPLYEAPAMGEPVTITRQVWVVAGTTHGLYIRTGPGMGYKRIGVKKNGVEVLELEDADDPWKKVCVLGSGQVGYMSTKYLRPLRTETEVIEPAKPTGSSILKLGQSREQLFRIYSVEQDSEAATVTAKALHVFYDDNGNLIDADYEIAEGKTEDVNAVMANINSKLALPRETAFQAINLTGDITGNFGYKTPVEAYLDPDEGIVAQTKAMLVRDNWDAYLLPDMVRDRGVTVRRGKNLIGVEVTNDISSVVTRIIPVGKNKNGDPLYLTDAKYVDSPRIGDYPFPRLKRIEYDVQTGKDGFNNDAAVRNEIKRLAEEDFSKNGVDLPKYGMDVDFVLLQNTAEYADYASLQAVHLYDTVTVIDEMLGLKAKVRVTGYKWNCLNKQYESVTLGELQDVKQTVYSYNLPNAGVSGTKIMNNSLGGSALRNATIEYAKIAVAAIQQLTADSITALTARIQELVAGSITTDELYAGIADITKATIETADIDWASINELNAAIATLVQANIGTADIDFARIKDMVTDTAIITEGVGGQLFISRLAVTEANIVSLTTGELVVKGDDGHFYSLSVDAKGNVVTTLKQLNNDDVQDLSINAGEKLVEGSVTAACLNAREIFADNAVVRQLIAANLDVDTLFTREAFINLLRTSKIVSDKSITMIAGEVSDAKSAADAASKAASTAQSTADSAKAAANNAQASADNLNRMSNIEVIDGTFAQAERRAGEGIHVFSEIKPKQDKTYGEPYLAGYGRNKLVPNVHYGTKNGLEFTRNADGSWTVKGTTTAANAFFNLNYVNGTTSLLTPGEYIVSGGSADVRVQIMIDNYVALYSNGNHVRFTIPNGVTNSWVRLQVESAGVTVDRTVYPMVRLASDTNESYAPYINTPAIKGWTELKAVRCGKNLLRNTATSKTVNGVTFTVNADGSWTAKGTTTAANTFLNLNYVNSTTSFLPPGEYIVSGGSADVRVQVMINGDVYRESAGGNPRFTISETTTNCWVRLQVESAGVTVDTTVYPMVYGVSVDDATYKPYTHTDYILRFGETVYGGSVDWNAGEMLVKFGYYSITGADNENWRELSSGGKYWTSVGVVGAKIDNYAMTGVCSHVPNKDGLINRSYIMAALDNGNGLQVNTPSYYGVNSLAEWKAYLAAQHAAGTPIQIAYELAEPYTIQLTPAQIASLEGINTVHTDADGGRVEFGHDLLEVTDSVLEPLSPKPGAFWLDRGLTPAVLRRFNGSEWETVNDVTLIETVQDALLTKQAELEAAQRETALFLKLDSANKVVRIGQTGVTSEYRIDAFGSGVVVNNEIFSRFEANRVLFGNMEMRMPGVGGLAFDSIAR